MTKNANKFKKLCIKKFGSVGAFSYYKWGNVRTIMGKFRMDDTDENRAYFDELINEVQDMPKEKVKEYVVSDQDIKQIRNKMKFHLRDKNNQGFKRQLIYKTPDWLEENDVNVDYYRSLISSNKCTRIKNARYHDLIEKLGV